MKRILNYKALALSSLVFFACSTEDDLIEDWIVTADEEVEVEITGSAGSLDLSNYVSIGNSLTAGYTDGALSPAGQSASFPVILSSQFAIAGGGSFVYPDISSGNGFGGLDEDDNIKGRSFIDLDAAIAALAGEGSFGDVIKFSAGSALTTSSNTGAGLNNFGVPGARVIDLGVPGYGTLNPYYGAFQSSGTASILADAASANASFFTLWIGSNDVLGYAIAGGSAGEVFDPMNPATITDAGTFTAALGATLDAMGTTDGVILTVPPVTIIPFFQTVTSLSGGVNVIPEGSIDAATAGFLNSMEAYGEYNAGLSAAIALALIDEADSAFRAIQFTADVANAPVITDESLDILDISAAFMAPPGTVVLPQIRQAKALPTGQSDLFPLTALSVIGTEAVEGDPTSVYGVGVPVPDASTLTMDEQVNVITAYATFNAIIEGQAAARPNITLVDVRPLFADMYGLSAAQATGLALGAAAAAAADGEIGYTFQGAEYFPLELSTSTIYQSVWSTDGVHPNPRGAALIANEIIVKLNAEFSADIPLVNPLEYAPINAPL